MTAGSSNVNPFRDSIAANPWEEARVDVPAIHGQVFEECLRGVEAVRHGGRSAGLLIHGEAGSGKTHLLSRLRARLAPHAPSDTQRPESLFVWVRLQTSPRMIWRLLRRTLVDDWFRPIAGRESQFQRILFHRLAEVRPAEGDLERWYEYMLQEHPGDLQELIEGICTKLDVDRNTTVAFTHVAFGRHLRDLRAWLAGTSLTQATLERIDLAQDEVDDDDREAEARQIVLMLCRLAGNGLPVVLSFDQVEALQVSRGDRDALYAFGQLVSTLHDGTTNVLLVSCVQSAFAAELKGDHARGADYDRIKSLGALSLEPLNRPQAEQLIAARLANAGQFVPEGADPSCWPLEPQEIDDLLAREFVSPRRLLTACAERFERQVECAGGTAVSKEPLAPVTPEQALAEHLETEWKSRLAQKLAANSPDRTEEIVRHGLPMLLQLGSRQPRPVRDEELPDIAILLEGGQGRVGIAVCADANMKTRAAQLRRLKTQFSSGRVARLVVICDPRVPLSQGAKAARQYRAELLEQQGTTEVVPAAETLAALDAFRELLSDAKSGDLTHRGQAISAPAFSKWFAEHLPDELRDLFDEVHGNSPAAPRPHIAHTRAVEAR